MSGFEHLAISYKLRFWRCLALKAQREKPAGRLDVSLPTAFPQDLELHGRRTGAAVTSWFSNYTSLQAALPATKFAN